MYGILKLQDKITKEPGLGWRERYRAAGTEEISDAPLSDDSEPEERLA